MAKQYKVGGVYVTAEIDQKKFDKQSQKLQNSTNKLGKNMSSKFGGQMKKAGAAMIAAFSVKVIKEFLMESEKLFKVQREAMIKQAGLMRNAGYGGKQIEELRAYASELQKVTNYGDEFTLGIIGNLSKARLSTEQLKQATKATLDVMAAGGNIDLSRILENPVAMSDQLRRQGIFVNKELLKTLSLEKQRAYILDEVNKKYGGIAEKLVDKNTQLKNAFGDLKEQVGEYVFAVSQAFSGQAIEYIEKYQKAIEKIRTPENITRFAEIVAKIGTALRVLFDFVAGTTFEPVRQIFILIQDFGKTLLDIGESLGIINSDVEIMSRVIAVVNAPILTLINGLRLIISITKSVTVTQIEWGKFFVDLIKIGIETIKAFIRGLENIPKVFEKIGESIKSFGEIFKNLFDLKTAFTDFDKYKENLADSVFGLGTAVKDTMKEIKEIRDDIGKELVDQADDNNKAFNDALKKATDNTKETWQESLDTFIDGFDKLKENMNKILYGDPESTDYQQTYQEIYDQVKAFFEKQAETDPIIITAQVEIDQTGRRLASERWRQQQEDKKANAISVATGIIGAMEANDSKLGQIGKKISDGFLQALQSGNIFGAIVSIIGTLISILGDYTNIFSKAFEIIGGIVDPIMAILGVALEGLSVLLIPLQLLTAVLQPFTFLLKVVATIFKPLFDWVQNISDYFNFENRQSSFERQQEATQKMIDLLEKQIDLMEDQKKELQTMQTSLKKALDIQARLLEIENEREKRQFRQGLTTEAYLQLVNSLQSTGAITAGFDTSRLTSFMGANGEIDLQAAEDLLFLLQQPDLLQAQFLNEDVYNQLTSYLNQLVNYTQEEVQAQEETARLTDEFYQLQQDLNNAILSGAINLENFDSAIQEAVNSILKWNRIEAPTIPSINTSKLTNSLSDLATQIALITKNIATKTGTQTEYQKQLDVRQQYIDYLKDIATRYINSIGFYNGWVGNVYVGGTKSDFAENYAQKFYNNPNRQASFLADFGYDASEVTFHSGGYLGGYGIGKERDVTVLDTEFIVNPEATARNRQLLENINNGGTGGININNMQVLANDPLDFYDKMQKMLYSNRGLNITTRSI